MSLEPGGAAVNWPFREIAPMSKQRNTTSHRITLRRRFILTWLKSLSDVDLQAMQELVKRALAAREPRKRRAA